MKILYITTIGGTMTFFRSLIKELLDKGHTVNIATNEALSAVPDCYRDWGCRVYPLSCSRSPLDRGNIKAVKEIKKIVSNGAYDIVHCHTPIASICTRLACKNFRKKGLRVIYTAHGFHFYKGAPLKNWLIYYPLEKLCSRFTDVLITINREDYTLAGKKMKAKRAEYVPGVGIDDDKFANTVADRAAKRREAGVPEDAFLLLSVGELNENKNHRAVIEALAEIGDRSIHYVVAGEGAKKEELEALARERNVNLHLLGYRRDVAEWYKTADAYVLPSIREGLNVSVMEAMASGLPVICSKIRGNCDLIDENGGFLFETGNREELEGILTKVRNSRLLPYGEYNRTKIQAYSVNAVNSEMLGIYEITR